MAVPISEIRARSPYELDELYDGVLRIYEYPRMENIFLAIPIFGLGIGCFMEGGNFSRLEVDTQSRQIRFKGSYPRCLPCAMLGCCYPQAIFWSTSGYGKGPVVSDSIVNSFANQRSGCMF